ncbi:MAG: hypothetical protein JSR98_11060 [Proteobacteria bacterium]|nr:hypothetical protein [Pseudomonadota bacterium]
MSAPLSPAAMAAVTSAAVTPRAVRHFGLAAMEARAARSRAATPAPQKASMPLGLVPSPPSGPRAPAAPTRRVRIRLWLPLTALFLLLAPFAFLLAPLIWLCTPPPYRTRPFATVIGLGRVLLSLSGTLVHVDAREALVSIRIF